MWRTQHRGIRRLRLLAYWVSRCPLCSLLLHAAFDTAMTLGLPGATSPVLSDRPWQSASPAQARLVTERKDHGRHADTLNQAEEVKVIPAHLRIQPGQQVLTPEQEAEARRFADERIRIQLSIEPVDEQEAEALLCQAYEVIGWVQPRLVSWLDGPLQFIAFLASASVGESVEASVGASVEDSDGASIRASVGDSIMGSVWAIIEASVGASVETSVGRRVLESVWASVRGVGDSIMDSVKASVGRVGEDTIWNTVGDSVGAYAEAPRLAFFHFFATYLAPNKLHAFAHFNELMSGYWLGKEEAVIVRRPKVLSRD